MRKIIYQLVTTWCSQHPDYGTDTAKSPDRTGHVVVNILRTCIGARLHLSREQLWASRAHALEVFSCAQLQGEHIRKDFDRGGKMLIDMALAAIRVQPGAEGGASCEAP